MSPLLLLGVSVMNCIVYAEAFVIVLLLVVVGVLFVRLDLAEADRYDAVAERDEQRIMVQTMRDMSRIHAETIARMASVVGKNKKGGR
jgi:hypothetical protein